MKNYTEISYEKEAGQRLDKEGNRAPSSNK